MKYIKITLLGLMILACLVVLLYYSVRWTTSMKIFDDVEKLPVNKTALLLGTSKKLKNGKRNLYFYYRVEAAVKLYHSGKIKYIIISGDHGSRYYNEPQDMKNELMKNGIPERSIYLDYAGFRTLDSVVRAKHIFGQQKITIISQKFHNERALFICRNKGLDAIAFNAKMPSVSFNTISREYFARVKLYIDLFLINKQPKFLGEKITIGLF
ncbi:MAG: ElyC/SanA/YdcF family protein [Cytophagales bacterium]